MHTFLIAHSLPKKLNKKQFDILVINVNFNNTIMAQLLCRSLYKSSKSLNNKFNHGSLIPHFIQNDDRNVRNFGSDPIADLLFIGPQITAILSAGYLASRYNVANPNEYLVRTGIFINTNDGIDVSKKAFQLPFQTLARVSLEPTTYHCVIEEAMSHEKISFNMPTVFTIGPDDNVESIKKYVKLLNCSPGNIREKIVGIIQGEIRVATGKIMLEELFNNRETFKEELINVVNEELKQFGLKVFNANIEELKDLEGNEYFTYVRKRALEGAVNKAKVEVAEQVKIGNVGEKKHITETRQQTAEYEKIAKLTENERDKEISESNTTLEIVKVELSRQKQIAEADAEAVVQMRKLELQKEIEIHRKKQEEERLRASELPTASVNVEVKSREAEAIANALKIEADGKAKAMEIEAIARANVRRIEADADAKSIEIRAYAHYIEQQQKAKGIIEVGDAESSVLYKTVSAIGGSDAYVNYTIVKEKVLEQIASHQATAVRGMEPKVTIWNTHGSNQSDSNLSHIVNDFVKTGVPFLHGMNDTGNLKFISQILGIDKSGKPDKSDKPDNNS